MNKLTKITPAYPGLVEYEGWAYRLTGSLVVDGSLEIALGAKWLFVAEGIKVGEGIKAGWGIKAGEGIEAGWGIEAGRGIVSGLSIRCKNALSFKFNLFAGTACWKQAEGADLVVEAASVGPGKVKNGTVRLLTGGAM